MAAGIIRHGRKMAGQAEAVLYGGWTWLVVESAIAERPDVLFVSLPLFPSGRMEII